MRIFVLCPAVPYFYWPAIFVRGIASHALGEMLSHKKNFWACKTFEMMFFIGLKQVFLAIDPDKTDIERSIWCHLALARFDLLLAFQGSLTGRWNSSLDIFAEGIVLQWYTLCPFSNSGVQHRSRTSWPYSSCVTHQMALFVLHLTT